MDEGLVEVEEDGPSVRGAGWWKWVVVVEDEGSANGVEGLLFIFLLEQMGGGFFEDSVGFFVGGSEAY